MGGLLEVFVVGGAVHKGLILSLVAHLDLQKAINQERKKSGP